MPENPYQPPAETPRDTSDGDWDDAQPPRYSGKLKSIQGTLDESVAVAMAKSCKAIKTEKRPQPPATKTSNTWPTVVLSLALGLIIFFFSLGSSPALSTPGSPPQGASDWSLTDLLIFGGVFSVVVLLAICIYHLFRIRFDHCDPPLGGDIKIDLADKGCAIEKQTRDGRPITIYCSWRQLHVLESPEAWLLSAGTVNPFLIPRSHIDDPSDQADFGSFLQRIADWQATQTPAIDLNSIPEAAAESFPDYRSDATTLVISSVNEQRARKRAGRLLRKTLPEFRPIKRTPMFYVWTLFLLVLTAAAIYITLRIDWFDFQEHTTEIFLLLTPVALVLAFSYYLTFWVRRETRIDASISREHLWYDYRSLLLRLRIDSFPVRRHIDDLLILATPTGSTTVVYQRSDFQSDEAFRAAAEDVTRRDTERPPE